MKKAHDPFAGKGISLNLSPFGERASAKSSPFSGINQSPFGQKSSKPASPHTGSEGAAEAEAAIKAGKVRIKKLGGARVSSKGKLLWKKASTHLLRKDNKVQPAQLRAAVQQQIYHRYLRSFFWPDLLATLPLVLVFQLLSHQLFASGENSFLDTLSYMRLLMLIRLHRISEYLNSIESYIEARKIRINPIVIRIVTQFLTLCIVAHWLACGWFLIGQHEIDSDLGWTSRCVHAFRGLQRLTEAYAHTESMHDGNSTHYCHAHFSITMHGTAHPNQYAYTLLRFAKVLHGHFFSHVHACRIDINDLTVIHTPPLFHIHV